MYLLVLAQNNGKVARPLTPALLIYVYRSYYLKNEVLSCRSRLVSTRAATQIGAADDHLYLSSIKTDLDTVRSKL